MFVPQYTHRGTKVVDEKAPSRIRSPAYPAINLERAIKLAEKMDAVAKKSAVLITTMLPKWGFKPASANGMKAVAALISYGLVNVTGKKTQRKISLSDKAFRILKGVKGSDEQKRLIRESALAPEMFKYCFDLWGAGDGMPDNDILKSHLVLEKKFNESAVSGFLADYKQTMQYADVSKSDTIDPSDDGNGNGDIEVEVGDLIQWKSEGQLRFTEPKKVRAVQEHEGEFWVFVEGYETGIPMEQALIEKKGEQSNGVGAIVPPILPELNAPASIIMQTNEHEWIRGPLSKESSYRIIVSGDLGPKEIGKLIRLLEAQRDVLADDDE